MTTELSSAPAALPADAIRTGDAIALLAGKALKVNSTAYIRHQARLARGGNRGRLTEYRLLRPDGTPRHPRYYSRAEVLALRDSLEHDGFTRAAAPQRRAVQAILKRAEREGLVGVEAAAELAGVTVAAVRKWIVRGRFGARKIDGLWFFEHAQVAAYRRPAARQSTETVPCAMGCGRGVSLQASRARKARAIAAAAASDELLVFCSECWAKPEARSLAHSRQSWPSGYSSPGRSRGLKTQWEEGKRDREAQRERNQEAWRSPKTAIERAEKSTQARYGHPLSDPRKVGGRALSRAQRRSPRSHATRQQEERLKELWPTGKTVRQIADELRMTTDNVKKMRQRLGLPPRPRGRRPIAVIVTKPA